MTEIFQGMQGAEWLKLNAKLAQKKNKLRTMLREKGILQRGAKNDFDRYTYFSEAQYKLLFTELFSECQLELKFTELEYGMFEGSEKQANGRQPKLLFTLTDCETGFFEESVITGEGMDKGDKAGYKAYTGALKYYLADTFLVATGDDPEKESPEQKANTKTLKTASPKQLEMLRAKFSPDQLEKLMLANGITKLEDLPLTKASEYIARLKGEK